MIIPDTDDLGTDFTFIFVYETTGQGTLVQKLGFAADQMSVNVGSIEIDISGVARQFKNSDMPTGTIIINNVKTQDVMTKLYANGILKSNELSNAVRYRIIQMNDETMTIWFKPWWDKLCLQRNNERSHRIFRAFNRRRANKEAEGSITISLYNYNQVGIRVYCR